VETILTCQISGVFLTGIASYQQAGGLHGKIPPDTLKGSQRYVTCTEVESTIFLVSCKETLLLTLALAVIGQK
jgi:hypothetical protein